MAHDRLARRKERRHVMFVLTDGDSDSSETTKAAVKAIEACGVTVIGIGIGTTAVQREFTQWAVLASARELPSLMLSQLTKIILGEKHKQGMQIQEVAKKRHFSA
jgi:cobalamin biosynthesis protein CobT